MRLYGMILGVLCFCAATSMVGQETAVDIIGNVRFNSPRVTQVQTLSYGVGTKYTDSTDQDYEELIPPFPPPGGFLIILDRACDVSDGDPPCYWKQDFRGLPDSVADLESPEFSIEYNLVLVNNATGANMMLTILAPDWPANVDSIHFVDVQLPRAFNHTLTGPAQLEITDEFTKYIKMTVYYNLTVSSVESVSRGEEVVSGLNLRPNPVNDEDVLLRSAFNTGDRVLISDMLGRVVAERGVREAVEELQIGTGELPEGMYMVVRVNTEGEIVGRDLLHIIR